MPPSLPTPADLPPPLLQAEGLTKRFGANEVLKGVSVCAREGDVIAMIGSSGSGKSTFLRCLNLLEQPNEGELSLGGEALKLVRDRDGSLKAADAKQLQRWRARLAMVFQNFNLWAHRTVIENVIEAPVHVQKRPRAECVAEAEALLAKVGIADKRNHYPSHLSGGQQQRAAIARAGHRAYGWKGGMNWGARVDTLDRLEARLLRITDRAGAPAALVGVVACRWWTGQWPWVIWARLRGVQNLKQVDAILDPGVGFGKTWTQHLDALRRLPDLKAALP